MDIVALKEPTQSLADLTMVYQWFMEFCRRHPDDINAQICYAEAERQMHVKWHAERERNRKLA